LAQSQFYNNLMEARYEPCTCTVSPDEANLAKALAQFEKLPARVESGLSMTARFLVKYQADLQAGYDSGLYSQGTRQTVWSSVQNPKREVVRPRTQCERR
jgi:hypothetical protein